MSDGGETCLTCALARWKRTKAGSLHPSGDGRCTFEYVAPAIPSSFGWERGGGRPYGGYLSRRAAHRNCPTYRPLDGSEEHGQG